MSVVTLRESNPVRVSESFIKGLHLGVRLMRSLIREDVEGGSCIHNRTRIHHQQQACVVYSLRNEAEEILFRIAIGIDKHAVFNAHWQRRNVTRGNNDLNPPIQRAKQGRLKAAAACPRKTDSLAVNIRPRKQIIHNANAIPYLPSCQIRPSKVGQVSQYSVLRADQVVTALLRLCIPELAPFALPDRVPANDKVPALDEPLA